MEDELKSMFEKFETRITSLEKHEAARTADEARRRIEDVSKTLHARIGAVEDVIHRRAVAVEDVVHARAAEIKSHVVAEVANVANRVERVLSGPRALIFVAVFGFGLGAAAAPWIASLARATGL